MTDHRQVFLDELEKNDEELFEKIKNKKKPDAKDLWGLSEQRFIEWRKIHDFPKLLDHFENKLTLFNEWKEENKISNETMLKNGKISPFLTKRIESKKKYT